MLAAIFGGGAAGGGGILGGGLLAAAGSKALVAKVATLAVVAGGATGGGLVAVDKISGGGEGNTATAMAGIPGEERAVQMVDDLRQRAHAAGRRVAPPSSASTTVGGGDAEVIAGERPRRSGSRSRAERLGRSLRTAGVRSEVTEAPAPAADRKPDKPKDDKRRDAQRRQDVSPTTTRRGSRSSEGDELKAKAKALEAKAKALKAKLEATARAGRGSQKKLPANAPAPHLEHRTAGRDDRERSRGNGGAELETVVAAAEDAATGETPPLP